ncbi:ribosomal protein S18-alanine N-acetyltransferase [Nesterenkonia muleiensis]|uniref:ribosomal protein S18-alanine N-acetyltransferase n=1 Tax=Nesterenkonia muleiensis TaxID=2282648 RepID=UPI000E757CEC|nr:ribosomal protein S18-alanine N-acetyltransferase [Nesterenkonia muleiensis]
MTGADVPEVLALEQTLFPHDAWPERFFFDELAQAEPNLEPHRATRKYWVAETSPLPTFNPLGTDRARSTLRSPQSGPVPRIIAYAGMMCVLPLADVQTLAVAPEAQGQGLGSRLLALIEEESRHRGAEDLLLEVRADNPGAQRLYRRNGFETIRQRRQYYPDGGDALIMRKRLKQRGRSSAADLRNPVPDGPITPIADAKSALGGGS